MPRCTYFLLLLLLICTRTALAAYMPDLHAQPPNPEAKPDSLTASADNQTPEPDLPDSQGKTAAPSESDASQRDAAAIISGARQPGLMEHQLVRANRDDKPEIHINYPSTGNRKIDGNIRQWATGIADAFDDIFSAPVLLPDNERLSGRELWGSYSTTAPSPAALSITFELWTYTGGAHGNLDIITLNYSLVSGQRLGLVDLFEDPDAALTLMSAWAHKTLWERLGGMRQEQMLRDGLNPIPENFASLTLTPQGVRINFQPYQVAPWAAGAQTVDMPLEQLLLARPLLHLWGR